MSFGIGDWSKRRIKGTWSQGLADSNLWDLVDSSSICAMTSLHLDTEFLLRTDPSGWPNAKQYENCRQNAASLSATNDTAERAIALMTDLSKCPLTHDENELQKIVQVVEDNRKRIPNDNKSALTELLIY